jgi:DNA mismatch repair protein MutS
VRGPLSRGVRLPGRMVKAGFRVAICEQTEDPRQAKGIVKREVIRVVTPGVTTEEQLLDARSNRYVCAMADPAGIEKQEMVGLSFLDVSTGDFLVSEVAAGLKKLTRSSRRSPACSPRKSS